MLVRTVLGGILGAMVCGGVAFVLFSLMPIGGAPTAIESAILVLAMVLVVALGGLVLGVCVVLKRAHRVSAAAVAGYSAASFAVIVAISGIIGGLMYIDADTVIREQAQLEFEVRLPGTFKVPQRRDQMKVELRTNKNIMPAELASNSPRREGEKIVLHGVVELYFKTSSRALAVTFPGEPELFLNLKLAANPYEPKTMGAWQHITSYGTRAAAEIDVEIRYRVKRAGLK